MRAARPAALLAALAGILLSTVVPAAPALADTARDGEWLVDTLKLEQVHQITKGQGVVVALIDTGVDPDNPDIVGNVLPGYDFLDESSQGHEDRTGHGTTMASYIVGHGHGTNNAEGILGVAPAAKILPITITRPEDGKPMPGYLTDAVELAIAKGADVINMSLSSGEVDGLNDAVNQAYAKGIPVIAAAGNGSALKIVSPPASYGSAIAVTTIDKEGQPGKESFPDSQNELAAPADGLPMPGTNGGYTLDASGSSVATAIVSGAAALVKARHPDLDGDGYFARLLETADDAGDTGRDEVYGWGVLNVEKAVTGEPDGRRAEAETAADSLIPDSNAQAARARKAIADYKAAHPFYKEIGFYVATGVILLIVGGIVFGIVAIFRSMRRRRERLEAELAELEDEDEDDRATT